VNENSSRGLHLGIERPALRQEHRKRAVWWLSASLIAVLVAYFLPVEQIQMRGNQLKGLVGGQGYGGGGSTWPPTALTGDDPLDGLFLSSGHHFTITYIGTDTTAGHTDPATFSRPTVSMNNTVSSDSTEWWPGHLNTNLWPGLNVINSSTATWLDFAPNYAGAGDPSYYGPATTENSVLNDRWVQMEVRSGTFEQGTGIAGTVQAQTNYPFFVYKVICTDPPPPSSPDYVSEFTINVNCAQGYIAFASYQPQCDESGTLTANVITAAGEGTSITASYTAVGGGFSGPFPLTTAGSQTEYRTFDLTEGVNMFPAGDGSGNFVGYLYVAIDPYMYMGKGGSLSAFTDVEVAWEIIPWSIVSPP